MPVLFSSASLRILFVILGCIVALAAAYFLIPGVEGEVNYAWSLAMESDTEALAGWFRGYGWWGPVAIIVFMILQMFLIIFPSWVPMVVAILGYGPWWGSLISLTGILLASVIGYLVGSQLGKDQIQVWLGEERHAKLTKAIDKYGFGGVAMFRVSPFLSTDAISFIAGLVSMPFHRYLLATLVGTLPLLATVAWFGRDIDSLKTGMYWLGGIGVLSYGVFMLLRWRKDSGEE